MRRNTVFALLSLAGLVLWAPGLAFGQEEAAPTGQPEVERIEKPIELRYRMAKDDRLVYRTTTSLTQSQTVNEQTIETRMKQTEVAVHTLEKVDEQGRFHVKTENAQLRIDLAVGPLGQYTFDSRDAEHEQGSALGAALTPLYDRLSGAYLWFTHTPTGKVTGSRGYAELVEGVLGDNPLAKQFAAGGTEKGSQATFAQKLARLPEKPAATGDTWETELEIDLPKIGKVEGTEEYELLGRSSVGGREVVVLAIEADVSVDIELEQNGAKISGRLTTEKSAGTARFDPQTGHLVSMKSDYTITGTLNVAVAGQNLQIPMTQTQSVEVQLLDEVPEN